MLINSKNVYILYLHIYVYWDVFESTLQRDFKEKNKISITKDKGNLSRRI